jgi:hypothetical protein
MSTKSCQKHDYVDGNVSVLPFGIEVPLGLDVKNFGTINYATEDGPSWSYGEIDVGRNFGDYRLSWNPALIGDGDLVPNLEHRISGTFSF